MDKNGVTTRIAREPGYGRPVHVVHDANFADIDLRQVTERGEPTVFKGIASDWPIVKAARSSDRAVAEYLLQYYSGQPVVVYRAPPSARGKFFYNDDMSAFNFSATQVAFQGVLAELVSNGTAHDQEALYIGSTDLGHFFPGLTDANPIRLEQDLALERAAHASIWIGNQTTAAAHFDISNNIACCVAGKRRFTLFPPEQIANLYPGPLSPTPAGQVVSMVDFANPDLNKFPHFGEASQHAQIADMEPGDILVYPAMWWHQVEALAPFNILINYWWNATPAHFDTPMNTLLHGMLSLRDRPEHEKAAWRAVFDYYLFGDAQEPLRHLPKHTHGDLAPMQDPLVARRLRAKLINLLNR